MDRPTEVEYQTMIQSGLNNIQNSSRINYSKVIELMEKTIENQQMKIDYYEKILKKIIDMESPFYFKETELETPFNYA